MNSVNTNFGALVALQNLNATNKELGEVQNRINTGLKVSSARDNGAIFAIAEGQRARVGSLSAVKDGIDRANIVIDTAIAAGESVGSVLRDLKAKAVAAQAADLSATQRQALQDDFAAQLAQINQIVNSATFNGANLVNGTNLEGSSNAYAVMTSDLGVNGIAGVTIYSRRGGQSAEGAAVTGSTVLSSLSNIAADDTVTFTFTQGTSATSDDATQVFAIENNETVDEFLARVATETDSRVTGALNSDGTITWSSNEAFTVTAETAADNAVAARFLGGANDTGTGAAFAATAVQAEVALASNATGTELFAGRGTGAGTVEVGQSYTIGGTSYNVIDADATAGTYEVIASSNVFDSTNGATTTRTVTGGTGGDKDYLSFSLNGNEYVVVTAAGANYAVLWDGSIGDNDELAAAVAAQYGVVAADGSALTATTALASGQTVNVGDTAYELTQADTDDELELVNNSGSNAVAFDSAANQSVTLNGSTYWFVDTDGANGANTALSVFASSSSTASAAGSAYRAANPVSGSTGATVSLAGFDFRLGVQGQALAGVTTQLSLTSAEGAAAAVSALDTALTQLNRDLGRLGSQARALDLQNTFLGKLSDNLEKGIGALVDADLAKESARLQSLQIKQQLGAQALSIANQQPSILLSFFR